MKPQDIRQGQTLYEVMVFINDGYPNYTDITKHRVKKRPAYNKFVQGHFFIAYVGGSWQRSCSLDDLNVPENNYNLHRLFTSRRAAVAYANRIKYNRLTANELVKAEILLERERKYRRVYTPLGLPVQEDSYQFTRFFSEPLVISNTHSVINLTTAV